MILNVESISDLIETLTFPEDDESTGLALEYEIKELDYYIDDLKEQKAPEAIIKLYSNLLQLLKEKDERLCYS